MTRQDMIKYAETKGYEVNFGQYEYNENVPYIEVNRCTIYIAERLEKTGLQGLSTNPSFSPEKLDKLIYFAKAYGDNDILDFSKTDLQRAKTLNNTFYPYFPEEVKNFEKEEYMNNSFMEFDLNGEASEWYTREELLEHNTWVKEVKDSFFDLRKNILAEKGIKYKRI